MYNFVFQVDFVVIIFIKISVKKLVYIIKKIDA